MPTNLGLVAVKSVFGRYLQAHADNGQMHASNEHRNEEETWFLIEVDKQGHVYGLQNWSNGKYMSKRVGGCAPAISRSLSPSEQWVLVSGSVSGVGNAVAFKSVADRTYIWSLPPGSDDPGGCGGEVSARSPSDPDQNTRSDWPGWWVLEPADKPSPGNDVWNTIGGVFQGVAVQLGEAAVDAVLAALLAP
jgi:hypothetical protein